MKKGHMPYGATIILFVAFLLFTSCAQVESGVSELLDNIPQKESLQEKALVYMTESYGDVFEYNDGHPNTSRGSSQQIERTVYLKVTGHPYDYILVVSPWYDDGKGETFLTDYPHYLFGEEAGLIRKEILSAVFPRMGYLPPAWKFITKNENDNQAYYSTLSWAKALGGLTKDSTVEDYVEASPIYGILVLPESGYLPDGLGTYESYSTREFLESDGFLPELDRIDSKYDFFMYIILLKDDFFDDLCSAGDPGEQLFTQYGYDAKEIDPVEYAKRQPFLSIDYSFDYRFRNKLVSVSRYIRDDGKASRLINEVF